MHLSEPVPIELPHGPPYAVREAGNPKGEPVFCLHGLMDTGASFDALVAAIESRAPSRYRFIAPDWRGHGDSVKTGESYWFPLYLLDLERLIDRLVDHETAVTLIAHSMGGQVASLYAGTRPARVARLVALDSLNVPDSDPEDAPGRYRAWLDAHVEAPGRRVYDDLATARERIGQRYPELDERQLDRLAREWTEPVAERGDARDERRAMRVDPWQRVRLPYGFRAAEAMAVWREVEAPVLCLDGSDSPAKFFTPADDMEARRDCFARLDHREIDGCGHMLHVQAPDAVAEAICDFLSRTT